MCVKNVKRLTVGNVHMCMCYALRYVLGLCIIYIYIYKKEAGEGCFFNNSVKDILTKGMVFA